MHLYYLVPFLEILLEKVSVVMKFLPSETTGIVYSFGVVHYVRNSKINTMTLE